MEPESSACPSYSRKLQNPARHCGQEVMEAGGGNGRKAAEILGLSIVTLWRKLKKENELEPEGLIGG